ncbi:MAG: hypothetical protein GDA36_12520 [Rhodobacteraceae bacterium]|nr:hypothetical protein [Paracoccaceae bacterium]
MDILAAAVSGGANTCHLINDEVLGKRSSSISRCGDAINETVLIATLTAG